MARRREKGDVPRWKLECVLRDLERAETSLQSAVPAVALDPAGSELGGRSAGPPAASDRQPCSGDPIRALVCGGQSAFLRGFARVFEEEALNISIVGVATSAEETQRLVRELDPDVILMDISLWDGSRIELPPRSEAAGPKLVVLSGREEHDQLGEALWEAAAGWVFKEKDVRDIADVVSLVARGNLVVPARIAHRFLAPEAEMGRDALTDVEQEILTHVAQGATNREIAAHMHLSVRTVSRRVESIYRKLHLSDRLEAATYAVKHGLGI